MAESQFQLSPAEARKLAILGQRLYAPKKVAGVLSAVQTAIEQLGYIQIDTISVVARAHHHTLYNRVASYQPKHLEKLQAQKQIFEYWSHAAAYLPMNDFRYSLPRKQMYLEGKEHWHARNAKLCNQVLKRIQQDGPLQARDFERQPSAGKKQAGWWEWKPAKVALEQLFMEGRLMIARRKAFQKVYDLPERVIADNIDTSMPTQEEFERHLITRYLTANALGSPAEIAYLRKGFAARIARRCVKMHEDGLLLKVKVGENSYYALPKLDLLLNQSVSRNKLKILSPFDNLLIQRKRTLALFDYNYQIECYVPAAKRRYGYFSLPLLWGQTFAGRMDAKIDRKNGVLNILNLHLETTKDESFLSALMPSLYDFMRFNQGHKLQLHALSSSSKSITQATKNEFKRRLEKQVEM